MKRLVGEAWPTLCIGPQKLIVNEEAVTISRKVARRECGEKDFNAVAAVDAQWPQWDWLPANYIVCLLVFIFGYYAFMKTKRGFADVL